MRPARQRLHRVLEGTSPTLGRWGPRVIHTAIVLSLIAITLETMPRASEAASGVFRVLQYVFLTFFAVEYMLRIYAAPRPLGYIFSFWGIVDFAAGIAPFLFLAPDMQSARALRLLRLFRLARARRVRRAYRRLRTAIADSYEELLLFAGFTFIMLYLAATGIYFFENGAQPEAFPSIPESLWWAVVTLTTVGYGDVYPVTAGGRIFTGALLIIGLGVVAVPTGILSSALQNVRASRQTDEDETDR